MKCRVKGRIPDRNVFGIVYPVFRKAGNRPGKYQEKTEVQKKLNERKSRAHMERGSIQIQR